MKVPLVLITVCLLSPPSAVHAQEEHAAAEHLTGEHLGDVAFSTSCSAAVRPQFNRAVALMHSFQFGAAIDGFHAILVADPSCAMAYWGLR